MGQAITKLFASGKAVNFDFDVIELHISPGDKLVLSRDADGICPEKVNTRATTALIMSIIQASFPSGMNRRDGRIWQAWLEILGEDIFKCDIPFSQVEWLARYVDDEEVKIPFGMAQWREALSRYLNKLMKESMKEDG